MDWVNQGGGKFLSNLGASNPHYIIECHGVKAQVDIHRVTYVSSHWIRSCLEVSLLFSTYSKHIMMLELSTFRVFFYLYGSRPLDFHYFCSVKIEHSKWPNAF